MKQTFQEKVFVCVAKIPKGKVMTYTGVASAVGRPRAARAVGNVLGKNPFTFHSPKNAPKRIPCHRVVRSDGRVGGYSGPMGAKEELLKKEGVKIINGRVSPKYWLK